MILSFVVRVYLFITNDVDDNRIFTTKKNYRLIDVVMANKQIFPMSIHTLEKNNDEENHLIDQILYQ